MRSTTAPLASLTALACTNLPWRGQRRRAGRREWSATFPTKPDKIKNLRDEGQAEKLSEVLH